MNNNTSVKSLNKISISSRFRIFEKARESALTLLALKEILTPSELETLELLFDKKSLNQISKSLEEAKQEKLEPIENILK